MTEYLPMHTGLPFIGMLCLAEIDRKLSGFGLIEKLRPLLLLQLLILYTGPDFRGLLLHSAAKNQPFSKKAIFIKFSLKMAHFSTLGNFFENA